MSRPGAIANPILAVMAFTLGGLWWWAVRADRQATRFTAELLRATRFNPDDIREAIVERSGLRAHIIREGPIWRLVEPVDAPADAIEVGRLLESLADAAGGALIPADELDDMPPGELGFDPPTARITLVRPGGDLSFDLGQPLPGGRLYLRLHAAQAYVVVTTNVLAALPASPEALRDRTLFPGVSDIRQIRVRRPGARIHLVRGEDGQWRITEPIQARADRQAAQRFVEALLTARIRDFVRDDIAVADPYGLDESAIELTVDAGAGAETRTLRIGRRTDADPTAVYAQRGGTRTVVTIPAVIAWMCLATLEDLRDRRLVPLSPDDVVGWCIERGDVRTRIVRTNDVWTIVEPFVAPADENRVAAFLREWLGTRIDAFADDVPVPSPAIRLSWYRLDSTEPLAVSSAPPFMTLLISDTPHDRTSVTLLEGTTTNVVLIRTKPPGLLSPDPLRFRSRILLSVSAERVRGLVLRHGHLEQRVLVSTNGFTTDQGEPVPPARVEPKLRALEPLRALTLVTDSATEMVSFGLDPPVASLTILDRAETSSSTTLLFGRSTPDGTYVRIQGRDLVALLDPETAGALLADLIPTTSPPATNRSPP